MKNLVLHACAAILLSCSVHAEEWGTVTGRFVFDGDVPKPVLEHAKGANVKDAGTCAAQDTYKQDLLIDAETKGIANVFIYLYKAPANVHPELKPPATVVFDQKNCIFKPHALVVQAGQSVEVLNSDPIGHNTHTYPIKNDAQNIVISPNTKKGEGVMIETAIREILPHQVKCDYHTHMTSYWLVTDHPYAAASGEKGEFTIKNMPVGEHELRIWHERVGYVDRKFAITVKAGDNNIGDIKIASEKFEEDE